MKRWHETLGLAVLWVFCAGGYLAAAGLALAILGGLAAGTMWASGWL